MNQKRVVAFSILALLSLSLIASFVAADGPSPADVAAAAAKEAASGGGNVLSDLFKNTFGTTLDITNTTDQAITKFLVFILVFLIIYAIANELPFLGDTGKGKEVLRWAFSAIVSYLGIAFLAPQEVYASITGYGAMAVTLTALIPVAVILTIAWRLSTNPTPAKVLLQKMMLIVFMLYWAYKVVALWLFPETFTQAGGQPVWPYALFIYIAVLVVAILMMIFDKPIRAFLLKNVAETYIERSKIMNSEQLEANIAMMLEQARYLRKINHIKVQKILRKQSIIWKISLST